VASINTFLDDVKKSFHFFKNHPALSTTVPPIHVDEENADALTRIAHTLRIAEIADFVSNPRLDDPSYLTTLAIGLAAVFVTMSWFSRAGGSWGGRFSPFGRPSQNPSSGVVNDSDFSYITNEDLRKNNGTAPEIVDWDDKNPERETDVVVFKEKRTHYPTHFPAHSIRDGDLKIGTVRQAAAKKLGIDDARRIRMFHKGRNLKFDDRTAREEGLRGDGTGSEILVTRRRRSRPAMERQRRLRLRRPRLGREQFGQEEEPQARRQKVQEEGTSSTHLRLLDPRLLIRRPRRRRIPAHPITHRVRAPVRVSLAQAPGDPPNSESETRRHREQVPHRICPAVRAVHGFPAGGQEQARL
jgi:hypothetical protein